MFGDKNIQFYGTGTVGEKGQIVIPAKAREFLKIKAGDEFVFFSHGKMLHLVKATELNDMLDHMTQKFMKHIKVIKRQIKK